MRARLFNDPMRSIRSRHASVANVGHPVDRNMYREMAIEEDSALTESLCDSRRLAPKDQLPPPLQYCGEAYEWSCGMRGE